MPFLLLLVGYNLKQPACLEHIFVRNRIVRVMEKNEKREYITNFEIQPPVPARNLFYGHSELSQYLSQQLPSGEFDLETMKLFAYFSIIETQQIDNSLFPDIRMAILSKDNGLEWITAEEIQRLSNMSKRVEVKLSKALLGCFNSGKGGWNC